MDTICREFQAPGPPPHAPFDGPAPKKHSPDSAHESSVDPPMRFTTVPYPERLGEILELRRAAYEAARKLGDDPARADEDQAWDPRNPGSTTLLAEMDGRLVGSLRLSHPLAGSFLHHSYRFDGPLTNLPPRSEILEGSWACVHPEYQGQGLFWQLAARMVQFAQDQGKAYLLGGADDGMWPTWQRCGYRETGLTYQGRLTGTPHRLMLLDVAAVSEGHHICPEFARVLLPLLEDRLREA